MYTHIHTDYTYTHTYLQTNTYIHQYMHVHTDTPHPPTGGRGILYIHTYILTYKYIHTSIHACTYRHAPPTHRGGRGEDHLSPLHTKTCAPRPFGGGVGGGACSPGPYILISWAICGFPSSLSQLKTLFPGSSSRSTESHSLKPRPALVQLVFMSCTLARTGSPLSKCRSQPGSRPVVLL